MMSKPSPVPPEARAAALASQRRRKMAESAHAFVRGSTERFYDWLDGPGRSGVPDGPPVWICGDCHIGNLGPVASSDGRLEIQIRDLDQSVIGNPAHDLIRLGLSLAMAARGSDLPGITTAHMLEHLVDGYEAALLPEDDTAGANGDDDGDGDADAADDDDPAELDRAPDTVKRIMRRAAHRSWKHLAEERIDGRRASIPLGKRFWPLTGEEREAIGRLFEEDAVRGLVTSLRARDPAARLEVADAAYWRKGCSSLGHLRFAVLVAIHEPGERHARHCLLDVKEAVAPLASRAAAGAAAMPQGLAERVVEGARQLSPFLGRRILASEILGRPVFLRELLPQDLKLEIERLDQDEATEVARFLAAVVGRAHARQLPLAARRTWHAELQRRRSATLDAPSWLWSSVVALVALHEAAYLEHCRRWALD